MREITLTKGYKALVDDEDFERVNAHEWCASEKRRADGTLWNVYAIRQVRVAGEIAGQVSATSTAEHTNTTPHLWN